MYVQIRYIVQTVVLHPESRLESHHLLFGIENPPEIIVLAPLCNEITIEYVKEILRMFPEAYIGIDLQGFIRKIDPENGLVSYLFDEKLLTNVKQMISLIGDRLILKGSETEMKLLSGKEDHFEVMEFFNGFDKWSKSMYFKI